MTIVLLVSALFVAVIAISVLALSLFESDEDGDE